MKQANLINLAEKMREIFGKSGNSPENHGKDSNDFEYGMTDTEIGIFNTLAFFLFIVLFIDGISFSAYPVTAIGKYLTPANVNQLTISLAFPAVMAAIFAQYYMASHGKTNFLFPNYSMPLIGLKENEKNLCNVQMKTFKLFWSILAISSVGGYILAKVLDGTPWDLVNTEMKLIFIYLSWAGMVTLAVNKQFILVNSTAQRLVYKRPKRLKRFNMQNTWRNIKGLFVKEEESVKTIGCGNYFKKRKQCFA